MYVPLFYLLDTASQLPDYFRSYGYIGIYIFFVTIDQIAPIPEEISLIIIGYLAANEFFNPFLAGLFAIAAFLTIDVVYYYLTKSGNKFVKRFTTKADSPKMKKYKSKMRKHMLKTLVGISFIPRVRLLAPVLVALAEMPFGRFMLYSSISLSAFTAVYIAIGEIFHRSIHTLLSKMSKVDNIIFIGGMVVILVVVSIVVARKFK